jgi:hypothetical protein
VVLGDVDNLTGDPIFDDSMRHAIRIALEQSRYVNVLSEGKIRESLEMARLSGDTPAQPRYRGRGGGAGGCARRVVADRAAEDWWL